MKVIIDLDFFITSCKSNVAKEGCLSIAYGLGKHVGDSGSIQGEGLTLFLMRRPQKQEDKKYVCSIVCVCVCRKQHTMTFITPHHLSCFDTIMVEKYHPHITTYVYVYVYIYAYMRT